MDKKVFFIHGWDGYPEEGWRPWLRMELEKKNISVVNPAMPDTATPVKDKWVPYLQKTAPKPDKDSIFIGHSLGCITILRYLESLDENNKVGGALLVAAFSRDLDYAGYKGELSSFFETPLNWEKIKKTCNKFIVIHSDDDPWVPVALGKEVADKTEGEFILVSGMKHFSGDDGITQAPVILQSIQKITS